MTKDFIDDDTPAADQPILSAAEIDKIRKEAREKLLSEKKSAAKADLLAKEIQRLKNEEGLVTGNSHADEMVSITIDLPTFAPNIIINMRPYWHGHTYTVARHVAETLRAQMFTSWKHQNEIDGKSLADFYATRRLAEIGKVAKGAVPDPFHVGKSVPAAVAR